MYILYDKISDKYGEILRKLKGHIFIDNLIVYLLIDYLIVYLFIDYLTWYIFIDII